MARLLGLTRGESYESPREITVSNRTTESGENGWLIRFFDSSFFCEWIAVSYLFKHDHSGVRDYLCNRMYSLPLSGIESYLFQICYMLVYKPSPSLDKFVIDMCAKSLHIALKVHWFLLAELEDSDDNEGISRIQDKCQLAATLTGEWPFLVRPQNAGMSSGSKSLVLDRILSSKQRLLSLASSPTLPRSLSFSPSSGNNSSQEEGCKTSNESKLFKKFIPGSKVRDALLFRKSAEKDDEETEKDGFFKRLIKDSRDDDEDMVSSSEGFLKRLFRDGKSDSEEKIVHKNSEDGEKDSFFKKLFKERSEDKKDSTVKNEDENTTNTEEKESKSFGDDEKESFFKRLFKDKLDEKKDGGNKAGEAIKENVTCDEDETLNFSLFRRFFRVHPEDAKSAVPSEKCSNVSMPESSPGTENFFRKLFRDRDRSVEDSELFGARGHNEKHAAPVKHQNDNMDAKPPLPNNMFSHLRKGAYHESLDFVQSLCDTSYGLVDVFPIEDRKSALRESLADLNLRIANADNNGGVCFPMGKGTYRVIHVPEDEAVLLNSREKAPYLICVEVVKGETPSSKDTPSSQKLSRGGIPLANGDALLPKPPPWAYPLWTPQESYYSGIDRMSKSASQAIDQAMAHEWDAKTKFVNLTLSLEKQQHKRAWNTEVASDHCQNSYLDGMDTASNCFQDADCPGDAATVDGPSDLEWVMVRLTAYHGVRMEEIEDESLPRRKEHRRIPSTIAMEEVKAAAAKGEAPLGLPVKGVVQESSGEQSKDAKGATIKPTDALAGELWEVKKQRICKASVHGKLPGWDLRSVIVKSGDDCRQEHLAVQLIYHFYDIFQEAGLPLWLRPYEVLVTSSYTALIETIPDTASLHSIKSRFSSISSLRDFFVAKYKENSPFFKLAQRNFVESMAGYSLVCYLLQVKDRHNGNVLMDEEGHVIHIDFGFMLSNSPGGVNFESAPFKLTRELLEVMDSDADGVPSEFFDYFKVLCIQGFLTCRKHAERVILLVEMLQDSGFPCFKGGIRTIQNLRKRFHLSLTEEQCVSLVLSLISSSLDAWRTRQYDYYQRVLNGIL